MKLGGDWPPIPSTSYDEIGNTLYDGEWNYTWERGRQLKSMSNGSTTWNMTYDADGMRTSRIAGSNKYYYYYHDGLLTYMKYNSLVMRFTYDAQGRPVSMTYNGNTYYYALNLQGDVMALLDANGNEVVSYHYNAWGEIISTTASTTGMLNTLAKYNPLRYRGYIYDRETGLYYLQSRYYNPEICRFINADDVCYLGVDSTPNSINLFAYCKNNPIMFSDPTGHAPEWWQWLASGAMVVAGVALVATGLGGIAGGALICAGTNSIIGSYTSEAAGGSSTAGWFGGLVTGAICGTGAGIAGNILVNATNLTGLSCIGGLAASGSIAFGMGALGSAVGQGVTALLDNKSISTRDLVSSALVTGSINCLGAVGSGMGSALKDLPLISTTSTALANSLNAAWSVIAEVICDFGGIIPSFLH